MGGDVKVYEPTFVAVNAPSEPQSFDIEEWKKERNKEMKALNTITLYKEGGKTINVNEDCVIEYVDEKGWSLISITAKSVVKPVAPVAPKSTPKPPNINR